MQPSIMFAADFRAIGLTVAAIVLLAFVALFVRNIFSSRDELGSEIELAANKKEYLSDEELEGVKLDRSLSFALVILGITSVALPFYWLAEPGRQEGAVDAYQLNFESRGEGVYVETAQCVNCHAAGGVGGVASFVLQDGDGQFIANANWTAPALNNVFHRYSEDEVRYVLNFGRPGSPMAAWGTPGGGPLTEQQVQNAMEYLQTLEVQSLDPIVINESADPAVAQADADALAVEVRDEIQRSLDDGEFATVGEAVFNLGYFSGFQAGALSCGRCHTSGWSLGPTVPWAPGTDPLAVGVAGCGGGDPSGIGFSLCGGLHERFPDDSWKLPDGTWAPEGGLSDDEGFFYLSMDGEEVRLDDSGNPVDGNGERFEILSGGDTHGDLASCDVISSLWEPEGVSSEAYAYVEDGIPETDDSTDGFVNPEPLDLSTLDESDLIFNDGRVGLDCNVIDMPDRTSYAQYNFIFGGADAGSGYGRGGISAAGQMPGFGGILPAEFIQAVVDYERSLGNGGATPTASDDAASDSDDESADGEGSEG